MLKHQPSAHAQFAQRRRPGAAADKERQCHRNKTMAVLASPVISQASAPKTSSHIPSTQAGAAMKRTLPGKAITAPSTIWQVHSSQELKDLLQKHDKKLVVLMCQASSCRPCKMFARKYQRIAADHCEEAAVFLEILGDENKDTRDLMISMQIWATPYFCLFHGTKLVKTVTGINAAKLQDAVKQQLAEVA